MMLRSDVMAQGMPCHVDSVNPGGRTSDGCGPAGTVPRLRGRRRGLPGQSRLADGLAAAPEGGDHPFAA